MSSAYVKGGSWSNVEDEILKAAVSKYGFNQWAKVASLLARKTAKQAKARWNEYLDPRLNKTGWSQQEDARLLELARLLPNQWRTIASRLGRTATQCIERYQRLLDDEGSEELSLAGPGIETLESVGASRDLQLGDINVNPETKEARPDAVDLDEDEKEMISEARARLANTKGKKATRKARERLLEETRRVALLQKRRDLKQAGVKTKLKAPKKKFDTQIDFNADIPFERTPAGGFYDTAEESQKNQNDLKQFEYSVNRSGLEDDDDKKKKGKKRERKETEETRTQKVAALLPEDYNKKPKLDLPEPVFKENELLNLIEEGKDANEVARNLEGGKYRDMDSSIKDMARKIKESKVERSALLTTDEPDENEEVESLQREDELSGKTASSAIHMEKMVSLKDRLATLPKPKNEFELIEEEEDEIETEQISTEELKQIVEDEGEKERLKKIQQEKESQKALLRRSQAVQKDLPIPNIPSLLRLEPLEKSPLASQIDEEMLKLIRSDYAKMFKVSGIPLLGDLDEKSKTAIEQEIFKDLNQTELKKFQIKFLKSKSSNHESALTSQQQEILLTKLSEIVSGSNALEKEVETQSERFINENDSLSEQYLSLLNQLRDSNRTLLAFETLYSEERTQMDHRLSKLRKEVDVLVQAEQSVQEEYLELKRQHQGTSV